ncbi:hypothetical protein KBD70_00440 [Candidatus Saccharibacteria bacterium]|jgi:cell division protein FtsL|nr:hypothetical protein [Candidatus Saccharibacteria bacterium]MBP9985794.1 hypothetical protein [Candidatus Saccharibacteria bacterium]
MQYQPPRSYTSTRRRENSFSRNQNTVAFASPIKLGPVAHTILVALMVTVLGLIYLTQATQATNYDYATQEVESQIAELNIQREDLEVENARLTAIETVKSSDVASAMVSPSEVNYTR